MRKIIFSTISGGFIGVLMCLAMNADITKTTDALERSLIVLNGLAWIFMHCWIGLGLPRDGDAFGWVIFTRAIFAQWILVGLLVGSVLAKRRKTTTNAQQTAAADS